MPRTRVMLVDDHEIVRFGLRSLIDAEEDMHVVAEAIDGPSAIREAQASRPDVIVMDIRLGPLDGIEACRAIRERLPETAVLMFTSFGTDDAVMGALVAGASGFLVKNTGREDLLRAIRSLAAGHSLLDPS
ncbi:MAG: response regulator, partial [Tepidiformaceae bacterium]